MRQSRITTALVAVAWAAVGSASLWSINALADGLNGRRAAKAPPTSPVTETTPTFGQLLGGPEEAPPPAPAPAPVVEQQAAAPPPCLTFENVLASIDRAPLPEGRQAAVQGVEGANADVVWCEGVREGFMLALASPAPPRQPEAPRAIERIGRGRPPGDGGGPGYTGG